MHLHAILTGVRVAIATVMALMSVMMIDAGDWKLVVWAKDDVSEVR